MRKLPRYVLLEFLKVFLATVVGATALIIVAGVMKEAVQQGLGLPQIVQILPYIVPEALRFAVPGTCLFAACSVYGKLSASNEVVAVKALGISPMVLLWPVLVCGCLISFLALWLNDVAVSWGRDGIRRVVLESVEDIAYSMLRTQRSYSTKRFSINVKRIEGRKLIRPTIQFAASKNTPSVTITAESGRLITDTEANTLTIELHNGTGDLGDTISGRFRDTIRRVIPLPDASNSKSVNVGPSQLPLRVIPQETILQTGLIAQLEKQMAAEAGFQMLTGEFDRLASEKLWDARHRGLKDARYRLCRLHTEPHRRWANGFSCLCFVFVGAPLAIRRRNGDFLTSFFVCFLPILLVYYPLMAYGVAQAKSGDLPPYSVWIGDIILMCAGIWLVRKVLRY